jgi:DHA2 family multidrug resistance protein-like MFS transporter
MLATARLTGMTSGATLAALFFGVAPHNAETVDLSVGAALAVFAAVVSLMRLSR